MTAPVLADALGPRARRRVLAMSVLSAIAIAVVAVLALRRLADRGQLDADLWEPFTNWPEWRFLLEGLVATVRAAVVAMVISIALGLVLALGRLALTAPVRWVTRVWVEFFRGVPVLLVIFFSSLGLPQYGVDVSVFWYLVIGLVLYNSAVLGEIFRAGVLSLERGQMEAALATGHTYWSAMRLVVIPQAVRRMVPALVSQLVTLLKDTSLGYIIAYEELLRRANILGTSRKNFLQALFVGALVYFAVNFVLSRVARRLEVRQRRRYSAAGINVAGADELAVVAAHAEAETRKD